MTDATFAVGDISIRLAQPADRDDILQFVEQMGFNPRDSMTWDALHMTAMTAWHGSSLVGAIPMEPRMLQLRPGHVIPILHQTIVALHPDLRGQGIGSKMQREIERNPPAPAELLTVFREDPDSQAYRWYVSNGFSRAIHIDSWFLDVPAASSVESTTPVCFASPISAFDRNNCRRADDPALDHQALEPLWCRALGERFGGFVSRAHRPLRSWLEVHPYRHRYRFFIIAVNGARDEPMAYALLGVGRLHSDSDRVDILEMVAETAELRRATLIAIFETAVTQGWRPIRWPVASTDADAVQTAIDFGFARKWGFDFLVKPLGAARQTIQELLADEFDRWRYQSVDYI